ncbi:ATP-binding protein [[Clostridium] polysaccharolyticum]|uniref:GHKL domain-containing protein n=1 Tax=[Clostridium] polysaccharolyticum TaxID=29364 RepID=A0A1H9XZJ7_9FIRM|nr:hypothetical protein [[Clostridium] polysaccharolyticum]SES61887.1 hypothetical protein SAMN04487772_1013 [[Clostridium] polysaccharolyticum]
MNSILEILLTGLIDPFIWIKSMSSLGCKKSKVKYIGAFLGYYLLLVGRDLLVDCLNVDMVRLIMSCALAVYIFTATYVLFLGKLFEKIMSVCVFFCILFLSELLTYELYITLVQENFYTSDYAKILNVFCGIFVKMLQVGLCYWVFGSKNIGVLFEKNKDIIAFVIIVASILSSVLMMDTSRKQSRNAALLFQLIEILFIWYLVCSLVEFRKKEKSIQILNDEVRGMTGRQKHIRDVDRFRHDYSTNAFVMKNLWNYKEYNKLEKYMDSVFEDVAKVKIQFEHPNFTIRIIISNLMEISKKIEIAFEAEISVNEFKMKNEDICTIFHDLVINALRESVIVPKGKAHVLLHVLESNNEYKIRCVNNFIAVDNFDSTLGQEQGKDSLENIFVEEIVEKYHGVIKRKCIKWDKKLWQNEVLIQIPIL